MDESELKQSATERIRWDDEEAARPDRILGSNLNRRGSVGSFSIRSGRSRREIDPSTALPVQYRTVSIQIEESKGKDAAALQKAKDTAARDLSLLEWHTISTDEALRRLGSSMTEGMSLAQAERKIKEFGRNIPSPPESHMIKQVLGYFFKGFGPILLVGAILVFVSWKPLGDPPAVANLALAIVLVAVFLIQAAFNAFQDWSSSRVMSSIKNMLPEHSLVIRDSKQVSLGAQDLVPGDIVCVKAGDKLPADLRFLQVSSDAKFDRSILTGESLPLSAAVNVTDENYLETKNIGLQGTHCMSGNCIGVVVSTGDRTVFGNIAKLTNEPKQKMTTLEKEVLYFVIIICSIMFSMIALVLIVWGAWLRTAHPDWINVPTLIVDCVSVAIAFIPEGLPIAVTAGLTITANLMRKNNVLCKSLKTVETLGSVSVICADKTGTLTENRMTVTECTVGTQSLTADAAVAEVAGSTSLKTAGIVTSAVKQIWALAALCNAADFDAASENLPIEKRRVYGDATDQAILRFSERLGFVSRLRQCFQKTYELAFNSKNKYMIRTFAPLNQDLLAETLPKSEVDAFQTGDVLLTIKGAPDVLINRCEHFITSAGNAHVFDQDMRASFEQMKNIYSSQGKRCILLARKIVRKDEVLHQPGTTQFEETMNEQAKSGLTLVGLVAIVDPLRPEIHSVISTLRGAGIRIFMVTGDFALTALAIAQDAGIISQPTPLVHNISALPREPQGGISSENDDFSKSQPPRNSIVISGPELLTLNEHQWSVLTQYDEIVFARTTPEQKLRIVREFQASNVVGMTGDGVNDAPSLKAADIGIAMGSGSDIAIEAADMVLLGSFSSVIEAVQYGRVVFDNLKKVICYLLPAGSFSEFWPVFMNVVFGLPQILSSFLMIIICCFTDCAAATVLSYEKPEADVLLRKPRNVKKDRLVNWQLILHAYGVLGIIETLASFAMAFWYLERKGIPFNVLIFSYGNLPDWIDPDYYAARVNEASSIYFVNLVVMQWFNLMATRTRRWSIFQHPPAFNKNSQNLYLFVAILFALAMTFLWNSIPQLQAAVDTADVPVEHYFLPMAFGMFILLLDEARKFLIRRSPDGLIAKAACCSISTLRLVSAIVILLAVIIHALDFLGVFPSKVARSSTTHATAVAAHPVVTDLTICIFSPTAFPPTCELDSQIWHRVEKDLYLYTSQKSAWLYVALTSEEELTANDLLVIDIRVGEPPPNPGLGHSWESRPGGIWVLRSKFSGNIGQAVTEVDVLFGMDAVDPRPQWALMQSSLQLNAEPHIPVARLSVLNGRAKSRPDIPVVLGARKDGKFKIVQISDTHMVTGVGVCKDAIDAHGNNLPESEADPLTVDFIGKILDVEKPDLVVLTGDQLHHDISDSQSALFKVVAPIIERSIPFAAVFGNHDSEGIHALPRTAQMTILQNLPFSLCEPGPEQVDGIGNFHLQILAPTPPQVPLSTLYFLDSHGQIPSKRRNPDYDPIKQSQIDWFTNTSQAQRRAREKDDNIDHFHLSLAFLHIPLPEFGDPHLRLCSGLRREPTEGPSMNSHLYDALVKEGISALGCGHDHVNDFCALLPQQAQQDDDNHQKPSTWLCYGGGSGFGGYCSYGRKRFHRRSRIWELDTNIGSLKTWMRVEYAVDRVDELVLVENGVVVDFPGEGDVSKS